MLQKILAAFMVMLLLVPSSLNVQASSDAYQSAKTELTRIAGGQKYIAQIDAAIPRLGDTQKKKLLLKLAQVEKQLTGKTDTQSQKYQAVIKYFQVALQESMSVSLVRESAPAQNISLAEQKQIETEVLEMQAVFVDMMEGSMESLWGDFEQLLYVQESGDFDMTMNIDDESFGTASLGLELNNYISHQNGFDAQFQSDFRMSLDVDTQQEESRFDMSGFVDYISKDGNMYLLLENLGISGEATQDLQDMIDTLDTIAQQNNYISFPADASYDESLALIQQYFSLLNPDSIIADMEDMMSQALLKAYEKRGDKIILVPTQYACDQGKILGKRFDPFYDDETCSPGQYQDLVDEFLSEDMQVYMIMDGQQSQFGIDMQDTSSYTNIVLSYDDIRIREVSITSQPKDGSYPGFDLSYVYGSHFDVIWEMEQEAWSGKDSFELSWKSELSSRNTLEKGTFKMDIDTAFMSAVADMQIDNGQIVGYMGVFDGDQTLMFEMQSAGSYKGAAFELKNTFTFPQNPLQVNTPSIEYVDQEIEGADCYENYYDGDSEYICYTYPELKEESLDGNFDIQIDTGSGKNNLDVVFDMSMNNDTFFEMKMKNTGKRKFQKKEIQAPRSSVPYEEVFGEDFSD